MKILRLEIESCMACPYMALVGDTENTIVACKNRKAAPGCSRFNARTILKQPMSYVIADIAIPDWCPLENEGSGR